MRAFATAAGMFALVLAVLLAAVGQLGKIDGQTLVVVLAGAAVAALVAALRSRPAATGGHTSDPLQRTKEEPGWADWW